MIDINEFERLKRIEKARNLRYKKAVAVGMNLADIRQWVQETFDGLENVAYVDQNDAMFLKVFDGDEEEAFEFRMAFNALSGDIEHFLNDIGDAWIPECFDDFFCSCAGAGEKFAGYDMVEQDYFGLDSYAAEAGQDEARKRLERLTKKDLIEAAQQCYRISVAYLGLRSRYEDLRASLDIIRAQNDGLMNGINAIEELYDQWFQSSYAEKYSIERKMDNIAAQLPDEIWLR